MQQQPSASSSHVSPFPSARRRKVRRSPFSPKTLRLPPSALGCSRLLTGGISRSKRSSSELPPDCRRRLRSSSNLQTKQLSRREPRRRAAAVSSLSSPPSQVNLPVIILYKFRVKCFYLGA